MDPERGWTGKFPEAGMLLSFVDTLGLGGPLRGRAGSSWDENLSIREWTLMELMAMHSRGSKGCGGQLD